MKKSAHETKIRVPFGDIDWLGHVNNARYLTYLETARAELIQKTFEQSHHEEWLNVIIARVEINYKSPARWNELLVVKVRPISIGNSSWVYEYEIESKDEQTSTKRLVAQGKSVQVSYDYKKERPVQIPSDTRRVLQTQIEETKD